MSDDDLLLAGRWCTVVNNSGSGSRFSAMMAKRARSFSDDVKLENETGLKVDAKLPTGLLMVGAVYHGEKIRVWANNEESIEVFSKYLEGGADQEFSSGGRSNNNLYSSVTTPSDENKTETMRKTDCTTELANAEIDDNSNNDTPLIAGEWVTINHNVDMILCQGSMFIPPFATRVATYARTFSGKIELEKESGIKEDAKKLSVSTVLGHGSILNLHSGYKVRFWSADKKILEALTRFVEKGAYGHYE